jgi:transcriptional repressor NrdR
MKCPICNKNTLKVLETRECEHNSTRRRKVCLNCDRRFTTYEKLQISPILVIKKNGKRQPFDYLKVETGIKRACEKRELSDQQISQIIEDVITKINSLGVNQIKSSKIGLYILNRLKKVDPVAYMRFASVYRDFENLNEFESELNKLQKKRS